jgi:peptidoglycan/LPS O-acetylase OafA/YrhL
MTAKQESTRANPFRSQISYVPGLDGLRALSVFAVLLYHAQNALMPGGFLGVEVFFVISGYLITSLLLKEWQQTGQIDLPRFWLRRARRLLPALFLLIIAVLAFAVVFLPDEVAGLRSDALAASGYITNWYFIIGQKSYFETVGRPPLLKHLWSLAVEEQFYLLWPPILALMLRFWRPRRVLLAIVAGAAASAALMAFLYVPMSDPSRVYYGTDTRAAGLLIGAALAFIWVPERLSPRITRLPLDLIGAGALGLVCLFFLRVNQFEPLLYQGGFAVLGLATALLIAVTVTPRSRLGALMGHEPLRWIGLRSYGIYLWHWPVYMVTRPNLDIPFDGVASLAVRLAATLVLAELSFRFVETPIRSGALGRAWQTLRATTGQRRQRMAIEWGTALGALILLLMALGVTVVQAQPPAAPEYLAVASVNTIGSAAQPTAVTPEATATPSMQAMATPEPATATPSPTATAPATATPSPTASDMTATPQPAFSSPLPASTAAGATASPPATEQGPSPTRRPATATATPSPVPATATITATPSAVPATATITSTPLPTCVAVAGGRVTAIGDSVMIGAADELQRAVCSIEVDAVQGRLVSFAVDALRAHSAAGQLGQVVVIHVGDNSIFYANQFDDMMGILAKARRVVFLNNRVDREWGAPNNVVISDGVKRYSNTVLVDWYKLTTNRPDLFWSDGMHLRPEGAHFYAGLVAAAVQGP